MEEKNREEKIGEALLKVALGYQVAEVTEEYAEVDGKMKLTKRKKTKKDIPPDLKAVQLLLASEEEGGFGELSDEDLEAEKARLLALLQQGSGPASEVESGKSKGASARVVKRVEVGAGTTAGTSAVRKTTTKKTAVKKTATKKTTAKKTVEK